MKQLKEIITTDSRFQKSVNLQLDLENFRRLSCYIPTRSSAAVLKRYLENIQEKNKENATVLIGPYGKGKSHLLLVLLAILQGRQAELEGILQKIKKTDQETAEIIKEIWNTKQPFLPVLVSGTRGDLNQSFLYALREALERESLLNIAPRSSYSEAKKVIENWRREYPEVYRKLGKMLEDHRMTPKMLQKELEEMEESALNLFVECYPKLTAGSRFLPMADMEALKVYQEVNRELGERYGYGGIILIFDEFSKYIEGHGREHFASDMKVLQDMCELANNSAEQPLRLVLVAHKSIHEYEKGIDKSVKNAFRGVEGRLSEVPFVVTAQNNYELIADALMKKEPEFSKEFKLLKKNKKFQHIAEVSYYLPCFRPLFPERSDYEEIIVKGCFPLTPLCAYALLHISEKVAQNERTIFTFLTSNEQGSLPRLLERGADSWIGIDVIYDYFKGLFRENSDQPKIHNEWLKADYALKRAEGELEKRIIKAMAVIQMIHREDEFPVQDEPLYAALGIEAEEYKGAMERLRKQEIVIYRSSLGIYAFKNNVGVDVEKEIERELMRLPKQFPVCRQLEQVSELEYVLPKQHNQRYSMTRYFQYEYMTEELFRQMETAMYLFEEHFSDGKILALVSEDSIDLEMVRAKTEELGEARILVAVPDRTFAQTRNLKRLAAIRALKEKPDFIEDNQVLIQELTLYEEDLVFEINAGLEQDFVPGNGGCSVFHLGEGEQHFQSDMDFNRFLSRFCGEYYEFSPRVNHELLNIQNVSGQYLRARNRVVKALLEEKSGIYREGTAPECMVYRAAFVRTGIVEKQYEEDRGCSAILQEIDGFFQQCGGKRQPFSILYQTLQGRNYGVRKGILPLFLAQRLVMVEGTPVIYLKEKELELNEEVLNSINNFPEKYELYIEGESAQKERYLKGLEHIFHLNGEMFFSKSNRWLVVLDGMQKWYRSLPQYTMVTKEFPEEVQKEILLLRNILKRAEINPREILFERIPVILGTQDLTQAVKCMERIRMCMDEAFALLQKRAAAAAKSVYGAGENESLKACLISWSRKQQEAGENYILSSGAANLLEYVRGLATNDESEIVSGLSKIILDVYMEDWNDETLALFAKELKKVKEEIEETADSRTLLSEQRTIILRDELGNDIQKNYRAGEENSTSIFLKNAIDEAMEEFADTLETNQKVAVLVGMIEKLIR